MHEVYRDSQAYSRSLYAGSSRRRYGFFSFMLDITLTFLSGGLWLIWIFVREMRRR